MCNERHNRRANAHTSPGNALRNAHCFMAWCISGWVSGNLRSEMCCGVSVFWLSDNQIRHGYKYLTLFLEGLVVAVFFCCFYGFESDEEIAWLHTHDTYNPHNVFIFSFDVTNTKTKMPTKRASESCVMQECSLVVTSDVKRYNNVKWKESSSGQSFITSLLLQPRQVWKMKPVHNCVKTGFFPRNRPDFKTSKMILQLRGSLCTFLIVTSFMIY